MKAFNMSAKEIIRNGEDFVPQRCIKHVAGFNSMQMKFQHQQNSPNCSSLASHSVQSLPLMPPNSFVRRRFLELLGKILPCVFCGNV